MQVWQPTPVLLPEKYHGLRSFVGYSPWRCKELDMTEWLTLSGVMRQKGYFLLYTLKQISQLSGQNLHFKPIFLLQRLGQISGSQSVVWDEFGRHVNTTLAFTGCPPFIASYSGAPFARVTQSFLLKIKQLIPFTTWPCAIDLISFNGHVVIRNL